MIFSKPRILLLLITLFLGVSLWGWQTWFGQPSLEEFLQQHWSTPIPAQGVPPTEFSALEASLDPTACAQCHADQYQQWQSSLHSHTMGPGIGWQLQLADAATAKSCLRCHAPMTEQLALLSQERGWSRTFAQPPKYIPADLHQQGLVCAACHVRGHRRYGPPPNKPPRDKKSHGGFESHTAFGDSRFCAACHQFAEDGPRLNGKLREDTYNQWQQSRFAKEGKHCQSCHMPERRHLWRGIHDPEMTRSALTVNLAVSPADAGKFRVTAEVVNSGAGHHFPTYMVPEALLRLEQVEESGQVTELARHSLAWRANLALTEELYDQRLAAGAGVRLRGMASGRGKVRLRVSVAPRHQYLLTFEDYLQHQGDKLAPAASGMLRQAIAEARAVEYEFIAKEQALVTVAN